MWLGHSVSTSLSAPSINQILPPSYTSLPLLLSPSLYLYPHLSLISSCRRRIMTNPTPLSIRTGFRSPTHSCLLLQLFLTSNVLRWNPIGPVHLNAPTHATELASFGSGALIQSNLLWDWGERAKSGAPGTTVTEKEQPFQGCDHIDGAVGRTNLENDRKYRMGQKQVYSCLCWK